MVRSFIFLLVLLCTSPLSRADFIVQVMDSTTPTYLPGDSGTLEVWGYHTEGSNITVDGWTLAFNLAQISSIWDSPVAGNSITGAPILVDSLGPLFTPFNYDISFNTGLGGSPAVLQPNTPAKLFDINFTISGSAATGIYNLDFVADALNTFTPSGTTVDANVVTFNSGSEYTSPTSSPALLAGPTTGFQGQFAVVPEPSALGIVGAMGGVACFRRRRMIQ